jgi:hypothetical protein
MYLIFFYIKKLKQIQTWEIRIFKPIRIELFSELYIFLLILDPPPPIQKKVKKQVTASVLSGFQ